MEFYKHVQYCFYCYVIKLAGEVANKVLLYVVGNPLLIEINLSQIRTLDIKREKVCAVCPYLLFYCMMYISFALYHFNYNNETYFIIGFIGIILVKVYSLYCNPRSNLKLIKYVRVIN